MPSAISVFSPRTPRSGDRPLPDMRYLGVPEGRSTIARRCAMASGWASSRAVICPMGASSKSRVTVRGWLCVPPALSAEVPYSSVA